MNEEKLKVYYRLILDVWQAMKSDLPTVSEDQSYWDATIDKYAKLSDRYYDTPARNFAVMLCSVCLTELERVCNAKKIGGQA